MQDTNDLKLMLDSRIPLIVIETHEEKKAVDMLLRVAREKDRELHRWSITDGLRPMSFGLELQPKSSQLTEPEEVLQHIKSQDRPGLYLLCDLHPFLAEQPKIVRLIKDIALNHLSVPHVIILLSHRLQLPPEISRYGASFRLSLPSDERIMAIIREEARHWSKENNNARLKTDNATLRKLVVNLQGLSASDVRRLVRQAIWNDGAITQADIPAVNKAKFALMDMEGAMSFEYETADFSQVAGLENLKRWLLARKDAFTGNGSDLESPKGIMLLGIQGGGKSLAAKAVAGAWGLPLLRLDVGALYNKYHGETERNLREALDMADAMSPCVLWLDEIEKAMSQGSSDGGTSRRLLGTLLTWMAERKSQVFLAATSNDISKLPPELIRKGRMDEIFFVDLPDEKVRQAIFSIHLSKRDLDPSQFDLEQLAAASDGFSGAEIEQAIVAARYCARSESEVLNTEHVLRELSDTSPLSVIMSEEIHKLRHWAAERTIPA
ncbi:AAA family ATPase [Marinimicrobium sp. ABcell2]|uniref:AAA family ATPase n=1 Tax=Marinimicrobium sp. ABcell2 TaxID=3069751 RepID=UPI0027B14AB6|nr:AAA family ATPase [Marinimicrobium sp. ABcell2]MDQ2077703.1 AAA family ATPase [Marinimicrobium sp. ABcell2]